MHKYPTNMLLGSSVMLAVSGAMLVGSTIMLSLSGSSSVLAAYSVKQQITDARQETQISTTYALSPYVRSSHLKVVVRDGKATLEGTVEDDVYRDLAKEIALGVKGIEEVDNQIVVDAEYSLPEPTSERSYGELIADATITAMVKSKLLWSTYTEGLTTNVDTQMGKVTLTGSADSEVARELAGRLASSTNGVVAVNNQLTIEDSKATASKSMVPAPESRMMSDSWISAKVKSTFIFSRNLDGGRIKVSTSNGVVTLSGNVYSETERDLAIELAGNIRGVASVESNALVI